MLGHLHLSAHLPNFLGLSLTYYKCFLDIGTMTIESAPHPWSGYGGMWDAQFSNNLHNAHSAVLHERAKGQYSPYYFNSCDFRLVLGWMFENRITIGWDVNTQEYTKRNQIATSISTAVWGRIINSVCKSGYYHLRWLRTVRLFFLVASEWY